MMLLKATALIVGECPQINVKVAGAGREEGVHHSQLR